LGGSVSLDRMTVLTVSDMTGSRSHFRVRFLLWEKGLSFRKKALLKSTNYRNKFHSQVGTHCD
jgi:hypothetical protein